ncbi:MAG: transcription antitermination regulator, partial [Streptosporangiaceae bacterium]
MISDEIAIEVVRLGLVREWSTASALRRLTDLAARAVPGCAGATCSRWHPDQEAEPILRAASLPELADLVDLQLGQVDGPELEARRTKVTIRSDDTLTETRWPPIIAAMLRRGVRSFHTTIYESDQT